MFKRLLLGIDDSPAGPVGVSFATALAQDHGASVRVLYVNQFLVGGRGQTVLTSNEAHALVDTALADLRAAGVDATGEVVRATCFTMGLRIAEVAAKWSADAIVLGSQRHRRARRLLAQGVRERVIQASALPILTAPAPLKVGRIQPLPVGSPPQPMSRRS